MNTLPAGAPPAYHVLVKPTGAVCNLDCRYCFFLSKDSLYPDSDFRMSDEVLEAYVRQLLESHRAPEVTIAWQGGEPTLMKRAFFERAIELVERYRQRGQRVQHVIQTNGTTLDDDWCRLLRRHDFLVGISIDGPREMHDAYRVDKLGRGTFDAVQRGWELLQKHGVATNVLCTVHAANQHAPREVYRFLRDTLGARFLQLIPIVERVPESVLPLANEGWGGRKVGRPLYTVAGDRVTGRSVDPEAYGQFLIALFDEWLSRDVGRVFVQHFDAALANWLGLPSPVCVFGETCGHALALEHNGDVYSCDHFVEPDYRLGNLLQEPMVDMLVSPKQRRFGLDKRDTLPRHCRECPVRFACHGECPKNRFVQAPDGEPGLNYLCAAYKAFFTHVDRPMRLMSELLRQGRCADEVMTMLQTGDPRTPAG